MLESLKSLVFCTSALIIVLTLSFVAWKWDIFLLSFKNLTKNKRRTFILLCVIGSGLVGMMEFFGYAEHMVYTLREGTIRGGLGHIQLYKKGYNATGNVDKLQYNIPNYEEVSALIENDSFLKDKIKTIGAELYFSGIIASDKTSSVFTGKGIEIEKDKMISEADQMVDGKALQQVNETFKRKEEKSRINDVEGMFEAFELEGEKTKESKVDISQIWSAKEKAKKSNEPRLDDVVIGTGLATAIGSELGDTLTLMVSTKNGGLNALDVNVRGTIIGISKEYNDSILKMSLQYAWVLMNRKDVSRINVLLKDTEMTDDVYHYLNKVIQDKNLDLELTTWRDLALFYNNVHMLFVTIFLTIGVVITMVVFFAIANVMTMSVTERIREIGTLRALGETKFGIMQIFVMEACLIGLIGGALSVILGVGIAELINGLGGIPHPPPPGNTEGFQALFYVGNRPLIWGIAFLLSCFSAFFSSILPAKKLQEWK